MPVGGLTFVITGLVVGLAFGIVLQRGRFCVNTGFRDILLLKDYTLFRAYLLAVLVTIVGANFIEDVGLLQNNGGLLYRQHFYPFANIVGGYLFGLGIVLAGGCGSGILYRVGEGLLAALVAVLGFFLAIATTTNGLLKPLNVWLHKISRMRVDGVEMTLYGSSNGSPAVKWVVIAIIAAVFIPFILKGKPFNLGKQKGFYWSVAGVLAGIMAVVAFWASDRFGGLARGLSFTGPLKEFMLTVIQADSTGRNQYALFGTGIKTTWSATYVLAVPLGAYISARILKEYKLKVPPADELLTVFFGGLLMGVGATIGGGCNIGQGLTGVSTLAVSSWVTTIFIILGNWTMVYYKLIKPMQDLDI